MRLTLKFITSITNGSCVLVDTMFKSLYGIDYYSFVSFPKEYWLTEQSLELSFFIFCVLSFVSSAFYMQNKDYNLLNELKIRIKIILIRVFTSWHSVKAGIAIETLIQARNLQPVKI